MDLLKHDKKLVEMLQTVIVNGKRLSGPGYEIVFPDRSRLAVPDRTNEEKAQQQYRSWRQDMRNRDGICSQVSDGSRHWLAQEIAKDLVLSGRAQLVEGGNFDVYRESDGLHRVVMWERPDPGYPPPLKPEFNEWEPVETLREFSLGRGVVLPAGFRFRVKASQHFAGLKLKQCTWADREPKPNEPVRNTSLKILRPCPSASAVAARQLDQSQVLAKLYAEAHPDEPLPAFLERAAGLPACDPEDAPSLFQMQMRSAALMRQQAERSRDLEFEARPGQSQGTLREAGARYHGLATH